MYLVDPKMARILEDNFMYHLINSSWDKGWTHTYTTANERL